MRKPYRIVTAAEYLRCLQRALPGQFEFRFCVLATLKPNWDSEHRATHDQILYLIVDGEFYGVVNGQALTLRAGDLHWLSPHVPNRFWCLREKRPTEYSLRFRLRDKRGDLRLPFEGKLFPRQVALRVHFDAIRQCAQSPGAFQFEKLKALMAVLISEVFATTEVASKGAEPRLTEGQVRRLHGFMDEDGGARASPEELAEYFGLSGDYFSRKFRAHFKISPREWLKRERIRRASVLLLESRYSIKEVAHRLGYSDQRFFARQFRQVMGATPRAYRRLH